MNTTITHYFFDAIERKYVYGRCAEPCKNKKQKKPIPVNNAFVRRFRHVHSLILRNEFLLTKYINIHNIICNMQNKFNAQQISINHVNVKI